MRVNFENWPYPRWIAHRGAGQLAPENTLAAFHHGQNLGYRMFECDVKLSRDGVPFLLHDSTLTRTSNATALWGEVASSRAGDYDWCELSQLDAGSWHSARFAHEPLPSLERIAAFCLSQDLFVNLEIKPDLGLAQRTGELVARQAAQLWCNAAAPPLLSSFEPDALLAALNAAPELPRALLLDQLWNGWLETALRLGCVAVVVEQSLWNQPSATQARSAGLRCLSYTVNSTEEALRLQGWGIDTLITDRLDLLGP